MAMDALTALVHWLHLLALATWVGALVVLLVVLRPRSRLRLDDVAVRDQARRRAGRVARWSVIVLIVTLALELALRALAATGGDARAAFTGSALHPLLFGSRYGIASVARWMLLVAALGAVDEFVRASRDARPPSVHPRLAAVPPRDHVRPDRQGHGQGHGQALGIVAGRGPGGSAWRGPRVSLAGETWLKITTLLAAAVLAATTIAGPYGDSPSLAAIETLHLAATLLWLGGSIVLVAAVIPALALAERVRRPLALLVLLDRFTPVAMLGGGALLITGLLEWRVGGSATTSRATTVAMVAAVALYLKALLLVAIVVVGAWSTLVLRPRLRRLALRARRDPTTAPALDTLDTRLREVRRSMGVTAALAGLALLCGAISDLAPTTAFASGAAIAVHPPVTVVGHAGAITVALRVSPAAAGPTPNTLDIQLSDAGGRPVSDGTVLVAAQPRRTPGGTADPPAVPATPLGNGRYRVRDILATGGRWDVRVAVRTVTVMATALFAITTAPAPSGVALPAPHPTAPRRAVPVARADWQLSGPTVIAHAFAVDPADSARLYEGTVAGAYRSTDGGAHWTTASTGLGPGSREVWSLGFLPDGSLVAATGAGVYRSTDAAASWHSAGLSSHAIYTLAAHSAGHVVMLAGGDGGIFRSDDLGAHWHLIYNAGATAVTSLAWPSSRPALIVAGLLGGVGQPYSPVVVSLDGGASWQGQRRGLPTITGMMSIAVAPGAQVVYAGSMGLGAYVSVGPADAWQARNDGLPGLKTGDAHIGSFAFDPANPAILYAATAYGVYKSKDAGGHWAPFGTGLPGDAAVVSALTLVPAVTVAQTGSPASRGGGGRGEGAHPILYATTAAGLYRRAL